MPGVQLYCTFSSRGDLGVGWESWEAGGQQSECPLHSAWVRPAGGGVELRPRAWRPLARPQTLQRGLPLAPTWLPGSAGGKKAEGPAGKLERRDAFGLC